MLSNTNTKNAPHKRRKEVKRTSQKISNSIIAFLTKETTDGDPYWFVGFFVFALFTIFMQGANIIAPLYWLGIIPLY